MGNVLAATGGELIGADATHAFAMFVRRADAELATDRVVPKPATAGSGAAAGTPAKKKICCACPDTKKERDECIVLNGEEACKSFIEAHKTCLRSEGFNVK